MHQTVFSAHYSTSDLFIVDHSVPLVEIASQLMRRIFSSIDTGSINGDTIGV